MRASGLTAVVLAGLALAAAPAADAHSRAPCAKKGSKTLAASEHGRIYRTPEQAWTFEHGDRGGDVYGCLYRTGRRHYLGPGGSQTDFIAAETWVADLRLAGRFVGFSENVGGRWGSGFRIAVVDLRTGKRRTARGVSPQRDSGQDTGVEGLVLRKNGSAAWMYFFSGPGHPPERFVDKLDADGQTRLAQGADIERRSLALARDTVYWTQAGEPRSAALR